MSRLAPVAQPRPVTLALLAVFGFGACAALGASGCAVLEQLFQKPTVTFQRVDITSLTFDGIGANVVMSVQNPNSLGMNLAYINYQFKIEGKQLAAGEAHRPVDIPAHGTGTLNLPVSIRYRDFVDSLQTLFTKDVINYHLDVTPGFNTPIGIIDIPIAHDDRFPAPRLPDVSLGAPAVAGLDFSGASVTVPLLIHNRNGFALPVNGVSYTLVVAGAAVAQAAANPGSVAANQTAQVPITARIHFAQTGLAVLEALRGGAADVALRGLLDLGGYDLPINLGTRIGK